MQVEQNTQKFNQPDKLIQGWYWAFKSREIKRAKAKAFELMGENLVVWRGEDGVVRALDAYCPHMGAHLAEGKVEGKNIRCMFHHWSISERGEVQDIPCQKEKPTAKAIKSWPVREAYGLIWIYFGDQPGPLFPEVPELVGKEVSWMHGSRFQKDCHPHVMMINAIDEQHFASVHPMAGGLASNLQFAVTTPSIENIQFSNQNAVPDCSWLTRQISKFYAGPLLYQLSYWFASTGTVTLGPDFMHFHIIFALRPTIDGKSIGQTILVTEKRRGIGWKILTPLILHFTNIVGKYFAHGDTKIFKTIRFSLRHPVAKDHSILAFIRHTERQRVFARQRQGKNESQNSSVKFSKILARPSMDSQKHSEVQPWGSYAGGASTDLNREGPQQSR